MNGPSFQIHTDDDDDSVMEFKAGDYSRPSFQIPRGSGGIGGGAGAGGVSSTGADMLINRRKVSSDVISLASSDSYGSGSRSGEGSDDGSTSAGSSGTDTESYEPTPTVQPGSNGFFSGRTAPNGNVMPSLDPQQDYLASRMGAERARAEQELNEKKEILYQMDRLESKGYKLPRKFSLQSDLEEMRVEFNRIVREKEVDASIRFQRKMMMAFVTGVEFLNTRFDPFDLKLDGWSEQVHENMTDYDDIFEELHEKYKSSGKKMAPELRLLMSLSGSAFMFHLTNSMFKQQPLPGVEQVLRSNPELMKQFQAAAVHQMTGAAQAASMASMASGPGPAPAPAPSNGGGMFGMIGNLFGSLAGGGMAPPPPSTALGRGGGFAQPNAGFAQQNGGFAQPNAGFAQPNAGFAQSNPAFGFGAAMQSQASPVSRQNVESVIQDVHRQVRSRPPSQIGVETLSAISDEEITSIIEDTADMVGLVNSTAPKRRGRPAGSAQGSVKRTLDL